ncbi:MAG: radical SAM protein [Acidobacteriota bacterium]|nr:radical SAM protein [Acidobacteriota bacterium]
MKSIALQPTLPLFPTEAPLGRPNPDAEAVRCRAGVEHHELRIRTILNRCTSSRMPFGWTINPYRGCEFGCTYCYARYTHSFFDLDRWQDFEQRIYVKQRAAEVLRRQLRKSDFRGSSIAIGTATDPYQPAEHHYRVTRSLLEVFQEVEGLSLSITTKSPLVTRDLDLLEALDAHHSIQVHLTITTADPVLARRIECHAPDPRARFRALRQLTDRGIETHVYCMPLMPGINDSTEALEPLFEQARDLGATDIVASPLFLRSNARSRFFPWLEEEFPHLLRRYRRLYGWRDYLRQGDKDILMAPFRQLKLKHGFPRPVAGRG